MMRRIGVIVLAAALVGLASIGDGLDVLGQALAAAMIGPVQLVSSWLFGPEVWFLEAGFDAQAPAGPGPAAAAALITVGLGLAFQRLSWWLGLVLGAALTAGAGFVALAWPTLAAIPLGPLLLAGLVAYGLGLLGRAPAPGRRAAMAERAARRESVLMPTLAASSSAAILTFDGDGIVRSCNPAAERMFGYAGAELSGMPFLHLLAGSERDRLRLPVRPAGTIQVLRGRRKGGQRFDLEVALGTMDLDEEQVRVAVLQDITEAGVHRAALSLRDEATGLIGRVLFADRTDQAILAAERAAQPLAVLLVHLKLLKLIRATLGDGFADQLLLQVISRLQESLRRSDSLARMGTAELALLLPAPSDTSVATQMAQWIAYELGKEFVVEDLQVAVEIHVGVSTYPQDGRKTHDLLQRAEAAMLTARRARLPVSTYRATDGAQPAAEIVLLDGLREAIEENQLFLEFLPVVDLRTDRPSGVEALVRWQHPESGPVPANRFVSIAEKHGLMLPMALRVISLVTRQQQVWREKGLELTVAINLSEHPLRNPQFVDILLRVLAVSDGRADKILFEVTEKTLAEDPAKMLDMLSRIAGKGCQFSLDDFGTGSLALPYLQKLPLGEVKIDRSFVSAMTRDHDAAVVVRSAMSLGNALGLRVVAEGVEDQDTLEALRELGCTHVQGYLIGAPMTAQRFEEWLAARSQPPADLAPSGTAVLTKPGAASLELELPAAVHLEG